MNQEKCFIDFNFIANKSFINEKSRITIPARFHQSLVDNGFIDGIHVDVFTYNENIHHGKIRKGWRSGGKYYQLSIKNLFQNNSFNLELGSKVNVKFFGGKDKNWRVKIT